MLIESFIPPGSLSGAQVLHNRPGASHGEDCNNHFHGMLDSAAAKYRIGENESMPESISTGKSGMDESGSLITQGSICPGKETEEHEKKPENIYTLLFYYFEAVNRVVQEMTNEDRMPSGLSAVNEYVNEYNLAQEILKELYGNYRNLQVMKEILNNDLRDVMNLLGVETGVMTGEPITALDFAGNDIGGWQKEVKYKLEELVQKFRLLPGSIAFELKETNKRDKTINFGSNPGKFLNIIGKDYVEENGEGNVEGFKLSQGNKENEAVNPGNGILDLKKEGLELTNEYTGTSTGHGEYGNNHKAQDIITRPGFAEKLKNDMDKTRDTNDFFHVNYSPGNVEGQKNVLSMQEDVSPVEVFRNEIIYSIANKAKALVTDKQSVIVVNLKPDSLGKITLRVATENNFVAAKILTENYQVKEIIENNFHMLKDALEKQGLIIHDLSVSVKDGGSEGSLYSRQDDERFIQGIKSSRMIKDVMPENYQLESQGYTDMIFLYDWPHSTINLRA